jgi:hypothetical protein
MAWRDGDISLSYSRASTALAHAPEGRRLFATWSLGRTLRALGYLDAVRPIWRFYRLDDAMWGMWHGRAPTAAYIEAFYADPVKGWADDVVTYFTLRTLLTAGREAELVRLYDRRFASPEAFVKGELGHWNIIASAPMVGLALAKVGRKDESDRLLALADAAVRRTLGRGRVPNAYHFLCAQLWAAMGDKRAAVTALQRAEKLGWRYSQSDSLPDLADEPAFAPLRGNPLFERIRADERALVERERRELGPLPALSAMGRTI